MSTITNFCDVRKTDLLASYEVSSQLTAIEDLISQGADLQIVLRLLCLTSLTAGGIKPKILDNLKREILQVCLLYMQWSWY
jgi:hypothetical protein